MAATATTAATAAAPTREPRSRGFGAVGRSGENGELDGVLRARAFRARDGRALIHHDALVALAAIVANVFVNRQGNAPQYTDSEQL